MTLKSPGEAYTEKRIAIKAEVGGVVKNLYAVEGRHVREGDLLVELEDREYRLRLERLEAQRLRYLSELFVEKQYAATGQEASAGRHRQARESPGGLREDLRGLQERARLPGRPGKGPEATSSSA